jgi:hypothetical protein
VYLHPRIRVYGRCDPIVPALVDPANWFNRQCNQRGHSRASANGTCFVIIHVVLFSLNNNSVRLIRTNLLAVGCPGRSDSVNTRWPRGPGASLHFIHTGDYELHHRGCWQQRARLTCFRHGLGVDAYV